ncbi:prenyltransferase/squalene oxidase repeat-containing protein [Methanosarcina sp. UBA5]|uniref:prenyltransferase/squalene oxidase repeat-containing protein n=1 Tax=Methanosarcina sp. UBA5 TaxID=1915593 RepID=UPI0025EFF36E|nr:prenyltransferase/squalene oxidase repeat-containing protein [Methanosarcina sp. UBA5]
MSSNLEFDIVKKSFEWLSAQQIQSVKELSSTLSAHAHWALPNPYITRLIVEQENDGSWNSSIRDTARACSALSTEGIVFMASARWLLARKSENSWNRDVYDTAYALAALADMGTQDKGGCSWLSENYCPAWEQVGTTSLIITALKKQDNLAKTKTFETFIQEKARWILSKKGPDGSWKHISTSNLAIQALLLAGFKDEVEDSVHWLLENIRESGGWGNKDDDINATALTLSTLGLYKKT